jgi:hypothetical protein
MSNSILVGRNGARVRIADMRGEEIEEPQTGLLAGGGDQDRHGQAGDGSMMVSDVLVAGPPAGVSKSVI